MAKRKGEPKAGEITYGEPCLHEFGSPKPPIRVVVEIEREGATVRYLFALASHTMEIHGLTMGIGEDGPEELGQDFGLTGRIVSYSVEGAT